MNRYPLFDIVDRNESRPIGAASHEDQQKIDARLKP